MLVESGIRDILLVESGTWDILLVESGIRDILLVESRFLGFLIRDTAQGIRNPSSTDKESRIQYLKSGIHGVETRVQDRLGFLYMGHEGGEKKGIRKLLLIRSHFASTTQPVHTRQQCSYMGAWASQATVPFIQHICRYVQISSNIYKRKNRSTKAGHENPKKPAGGKNTGNVYPRPRQWCNPWGFRVC